MFNIIFLYLLILFILYIFVSFDDGGKKEVKKTEKKKKGIDHMISYEVIPWQINYKIKWRIDLGQHQTMIYLELMRRLEPMKD